MRVGETVECFYRRPRMDAPPGASFADEWPLRRRYCTEAYLEHVKKQELSRGLHDLEHVKKQESSRGLHGDSEGGKRGRDGNAQPAHAVESTALKH